MARPKLKDVLASRRHVNGIKPVPLLVEQSEIDELKAEHEAELEGIRDALKPLLAELADLRAKNKTATEALENALKSWDEVNAENEELRKGAADLAGVQSALAEKAAEVEALNVARATDLKEHQEATSNLRKQFEEMMALNQQVAAPPPPPPPAPEPISAPAPQPRRHGQNDILSIFFGMQDQIDNLKRDIKGKRRVSSSMKTGAHPLDVTHIQEEAVPRNETPRESIKRAIATERERAAARIR